MDNRFNSKQIVWLLCLSLILFTLAACERPLNESDEAVTGTSEEEAADGLTPDGGSTDLVLTRVIVPPTPEMVSPEGEPVDTTDASDGVETDMALEEANQASGESTSEETTQPESATPIEEVAPEQIHIVQAGDNLYRIGLQYGCTIEELATYNQMANPDYVDVGDEIRIPPDCEG